MYSNRPTVKLKSTVGQGNKQNRLAGCRFTTLNSLKRTDNASEKRRQVCACFQLSTVRRTCTCRQKQTKHLKQSLHRDWAEQGTLLQGLSHLAPFLGTLEEVNLTRDRIRGFWFRGGNADSSANRQEQNFLLCSVGRQCFQRRCVARFVRVVDLYPGLQVQGELRVLVVLCCDLSAREVIRLFGLSWTEGVWRGERRFGVCQVLLRVAERRVEQRQNLLGPGRYTIK